MSKASKRCWPTNPNSVGCHVASVCTPCCMLLDVVRVVAECLKPVKLLATCKQTQQLAVVSGFWF